jgi:hypothetical protein
MPAMVASLLLSLLDPTAWIAWFVHREAAWEVERVSAGDTLAEASTPLAAKWRGYLGLKLKRDAASQDLRVVISAMSAETSSFHNVLTPAEFNWFIHIVDRMRGELRAYATTAAGAPVKQPFWGISRELCGFGARTNNGRHGLSLHLKQYRSSPAYVELQSSTGGRACQMSTDEFVEFSGSVNHIRSAFPPGSLRW